MATVYMMIGIQGSGKTTFARILEKGLGISILSSDELRTARPDLDEKEVFPTLYKMCAEKINNNESFVYDATNITPRVRMRFNDTMASLGVERNAYDLIGVYFEPDVALSTERVKKRNEDPSERFLPLEIIADFAKNLVEPTLDEGFNQIIKFSNYKKNE